MGTRQPVIISLGGSIVVPDGIDTDFIARFRTLLMSYIARGQRFVLIVGGGRLARRYVSAAQQVNPNLTDEDRDWMGIHATRLNAHLLRTVFRDVAFPRINKNPHDLEDFYQDQWRHPLFIAAGWRPGFSTDYDATLLARYLDISTILNLSNIDYVYTADPRNDPNAQPITAISWHDFRSMVGDAWSPSMNAPFDPVASRLAHESNITVVVMNGKNLDNVAAYMDGTPFEGTVIGSGASELRTQTTDA